LNLSIQINIFKFQRLNLILIEIEHLTIQNKQKQYVNSRAGININELDTLDNDKHLDTNIQGIILILFGFHICFV
jgi:hypothetical protein